MKYFNTSVGKLLKTGREFGSFLLNATSHYNVLANLSQLMKTFFWLNYK